MVFKKLDDIEIDWVKITNIYRGCDYYPRTNGYNYDFYFNCDLDDKDEVYDLCKKCLPGRCESREMEKHPRHIFRRPRLCVYVDLSVKHR